MQALNDISALQFSVETQQCLETLSVHAGTDFTRLGVPPISSVME